MATWGDHLLRAAAGTRKSAILIAPFIKEHALRRVLARLENDVSVCVVTRWRPDEVAAGVSDLSVLDAVLERPGSRLLLFASLHAKYYRFDENVLVGSANLTGAALGWASSPNLELLIPAPWPSPELLEFEAAAIRGGIAATKVLQAAILAAARSFGEPLAESVTLTATSAEPLFLPKTRNPEILFRAYSSPAADLTTAAREQTSDDLRGLSLPPGLSVEQFRAVVGAILLQSPIVVAVDELASSPRRFGEVRQLLKSRLAELGIQRDATEAWQTLARWLTYFLPQQYELLVPRFSEVFARVDRSGD